MIIYLVTNKINGLKYVGQTIGDLFDRKRQHEYSSLNGSKYYFHRALKKYGFINFNWDVIEVVHEIILLNEREMYYIDLYNTFLGDGYNSTIGGRGVSGWKHSDESKKKIGSASRLNKLGKKLSDETKEKIGKYSKGKTYKDLYGDERATKLINDKKKTYIDKYGIDKANEIKNKLSVNNKSGDILTKNKMSKSYKNRLDSNGKRCDISEIGREEMSKSKLGDKNHNFIKIDDNLIPIILLEYENNDKHITKKMCEKFNLSDYLIMKILKENGKYVYRK
jgi:group I intron endonuclease